MSELDKLTFARIKTQMMHNASPDQRGELQALLIGGAMTLRVFTHTDVDNMMDLSAAVQSQHFWAVLNVQSIASALIAVSLSNNGKENRRLIRGLKSDLITHLDRLKDNLRDSAKLNVNGFIVNTEYAEACLPIWKDLYHAADAFIAAGETDAAKQALQRFATTYNDQLKPYSDSLTKRGKRNPDSNTSKLLERIDAKIHSRYKPGAGYEQVVLDVANEYRRDGDTEAAEYIDDRKNKHQFGRDAIDRAERRLAITVSS